MVEITESKRAAEATRTLAESSRVLARWLDRDALAHRIADGVRQLFDATVALLDQLEPGSGAMIAVAILTEEDTFDFFFSSRRRHTRSDRDWSSDVCSSD